MKEKSASQRLFKILGWSLVLAFLLTLVLTAVSSLEIVPGLDNKVVFAQDGEDDDGDDEPGQGYCPDGVTSVPAGVDKIQFCRDNGQFAPFWDFIEDLWCRLIARFRMYFPVGFHYEVICLEEGPAPLPPGIREVDYRIVTLVKDSDGTEREKHVPPLLWKLLNAQDFASPDDFVVLLRWNDDVEPARWQNIPGSPNEDGTIDYLISDTSVFAVGLTNDPNIAQTFIAPETVIPAGLPRTGGVETRSMPWGAGILVVGGMAVVFAVGLWYWRGR